MKRVMKLSEETDPLNEKGTRHSQNTLTKDYNCLSYATRTFAWTMPYNDFDERFDDVKCLLRRYDYDECAEILLDIDTEALLDMYGDRIRQIESEEDLQEGELLVAFREYVGENWGFDFDEDDDTDFHAIVKIDDTWYEKCGENPPRKVNMDDMWRNPSGFYYNSRTAFFAVKED